MELYKLHMLKHPPKLPNGPATYQLLIAREASQSGSVQSVNFPLVGLTCAEAGERRGG
jgi:hypothetical protein